MIQLTPHLWIAQSRLYFTNSGIFISAGQACLVDPCIFPDEIESIASFVAQQGAVPQAIILTHSHWDHILGPERFPGAKILAHAHYLSETSGEYGAHIRQEIRDWETEHNVERDQPFVIPRPHATFEGRTSLAVGDLALDLIHTPGHAADQLVVYHADGATLWAADMLSDLEIPFVSHDLAAYEQTLAMLSQLDVRILVPGHGQPTADPAEIRARLSDDRAYLAELRDKVGQAVRRGKTVREAVELCADMRYRHPAGNKGPHRLNVESVYLEFGGVADPAQVGWNQFLSQAAGDNQGD